MIVQVDPSWMQAILIVVATAAAILLIWANRAKLASINTPYIDTLIGKSMQWLVAIVIVTTIVTAILAVVGISQPIRLLSPENIAYLAGAYWLVSKARD
jgi:choline-glycine betaine transporter